jgi:hypothetical protein
MTRFSFKASALALAALLLMASASVRADLTSVNPNAPTGEDNLTTIMTNIYGAGTFNRIDDNTDTIWGFTAPSAAFDAQVRFAGHISSFGVLQDPNAVPGAGTYTQLADISGSGYSAVFTNNNPTYSTLSGGVLTINGPTGTPPPTDLPGILALAFNDTSAGNYWSSNMGKNNDPGSNPPGVGPNNPTDHMVTFFVNSATANFTGYVIAYEDLSHDQNSDRDFNDAVIQINGGLAPVPEPSTMVIAGLAMIGFAGYGIRRRRVA